VIREVHHTTGSGSLIGSVEPVARRVLSEFPLATLVVGGGILGVVTLQFSGTL
jgi:hypothetical protein